jgi:hypothetical protein
MAREVSSIGSQTLKGASATKLFQAGGDLTPHSTAFEPSIYRQRHAATTRDGALRFIPQVIGSPRLSGKTTQVNTICSYHQRGQGPWPVRRIDCVMPKGPHGITEEALRLFLAERLVAKPTGTLADILRSSALLRGAHERRVLAIINSEALTHHALRWLLAGFRAAYEKPDVTTELRVQLLVDGSFGVETLTAHPESDYPLPQAFPPEFTREEQTAFITTRLDRLALQMSKTAMRQLWEGTSGDKYLTQAVGASLAREQMAPRAALQRRGTRVIQSRAVQEALDDPEQWKPLFDTAVASVAQLVTLRENDDFQFQGFLENLNERWPTLPSEVKSIAYEGGLVRRTGDREATLRAPILKEVLKEAIARAYRCLGLLRLGFSLQGVHDDHRFRARDAMMEIVSNAAADRLIVLHTGFGRVTGANTVKMTAFTTDTGRYTGTWSAPTAAHPTGTPVWGLMWTVDKADGRRTTHVEVLRVGRRNAAPRAAEAAAGTDK